MVRKPIEFCSLKTQKRKRKATITKNELTRNHLKICQQNQIKYRYVLADSWFASKENMIWIEQQLKKHFIMALKSNRTAMPNRQRSCRNAPAFVALSEEEKQEGKFTRIDSLYWSKPEPVKAWLKGLEFPVLLHRQVFTNQDGSTGTLYLACSDLTCNASNIEVRPRVGERRKGTRTFEAIYQKRWKVEVFHKTLKSNTGLAKSPTRCVRTQINHIFMSIYAAFQLECLSLKHKMNHFALRSRIYIQALKHAMLELHSLKSA